MNAKADVTAEPRVFYVVALMVEIVVVMSGNETVALMVWKKVAEWDFLTVVERGHFLVAKTVAVKDFSVVAAMVYAMVSCLVEKLVL